jgi:membrane protein implicated in regulation of membrane protease activity
MKLPVMFYVWITTLLLITVTIMVSMDMPFNWVFYLTCLGQVLVAIMVYKVLTDNYKTDKTFADFYEDHPIGKQEFN